MAKKVTYEPRVTIVKRCGICGCYCYISIRESQYNMWLSGVLSIEGLTDVPIEQRIPLVSGLCSDCHESLNAERS